VVRGKKGKILVKNGDFEKKLEIINTNGK